MRWSKEGANNLAKVLYRKENKELCSTIERYTDGLIFTAQMKEIVETLSGAKAPTKDGKGNRYADLIGRLLVSGNHSNLFGLQYFNKKDLQSMGLNALVLVARSPVDFCFARTEVKRRPMRSKLFY